MRLLDFLFPERRNTAAVARDRLKIVLAHERASRDAPDFLPALQKDLLDVVGRYVEIRDDMLRVNLAQAGETSLLEINVELDGAAVKPVKNGAAAPPPKPAPIRVAPPDRASHPPWVKPELRSAGSWQRRKECPARSVSSGSARWAARWRSIS